MSRLLCGTSGYSYDHWRGLFYPDGVRQKDRLAFYAERFPAVELNVTYYRLPQRQAFETWRRHTPDDFRFALKGSRAITQYHRLANAEEFVRNFFGRAEALGDKLDVMLWQLLPLMKADVGRLDEFCRLVRKVSPVRQAFEFRNESWFSEEVYAVLREHGCALCVSHSPSWPMREVLTADFTYVRFHGGQTLYDSEYSADELGDWAAKVRRWLLGGTDVYAFFNNDVHAFAPVDALRLTELVEGNTD